MDGERDWTNLGQNVLQDNSQIQSIRDLSGVLANTQIPRPPLRPVKSELSEDRFQESTFLTRTPS